MVSLADTDGQQAFGQLVDALVKLAEGKSQVAVGVDDEFMIRQALNLVFKKSADGFISMGHYGFSVPEQGA